jgi:hypothetical protein
LRSDHTAASDSIDIRFFWICIDARQHSLVGARRLMDPRVGAFDANHWR